MSSGASNNGKCQSDQQAYGYGEHEKNQRYLLTSGFVRNCKLAQHVPSEITNLCATYFVLLNKGVKIKWILNMTLKESNMYTITSYFAGFDFIIALSTSNDIKQCNITLETTDQTNYNIKTFTYELCLNGFNKSLFKKLNTEQNLGKYSKYVHNDKLSKSGFINYNAKQHIQTIFDLKNISLNALQSITCFLDIAPREFSMHFGEYINKPIIVTFNQDTTVIQAIDITIKEWNLKYNQISSTMKLKGTSSKNYELRYLDDCDSDDIEIDNDCPQCPAITDRDYKIYHLGEDGFGIQYKH